jgi:hypothetical protein
MSSSDGEEMDVENDDDEENEVELGLNDEVCIVFVQRPKGFGYLMHKYLILSSCFIE